MSEAARDEGGFTLIELLVSLAILAVALSVLFSAIAGSLARSRVSHDETLATSLVQSLLARAGTEWPLHQGETTGAYSNGFRWRLLVRPYAGDEDRKAWHVSAYVVDAIVVWQDGSQTRSEALETLRIVPPKDTSR